MIAVYESSLAWEKNVSTTYWYIVYSKGVLKWLGRSTFLVSKRANPQ